MANITAGVIGAVIGFIIAGPAGALKGFAIGMMVGQLFAPNQKVEGPRLEDLKPQSSEYGRPIPIGYATFGLAGNVIWAADLIEGSHEESSNGADYTVYDYYADFAIALCEGPIHAVTRIWAGQDRRLIYDNREGLGVIEGGEVTIYPGDEEQLPDPTMESYEGEGNVPAYRGTAYALFKHLPLKKDGNRIPYLWFEIITTGTTTASLRWDNVWKLTQITETGRYAQIGLVDAFTASVRDHVRGSPGSAYIEGVRSKYGASSGKIYFEATLTQTALGLETYTDDLLGVGICGASTTFADAAVGNSAVVLRAEDGTGKIMMGGSVVADLGTLDEPITIGIAVDIDSKRAFFRLRDGSWNGTGADPTVPSTGIDFSSAGLGSVIHAVGVLKPAADFEFVEGDPFGGPGS